MAEVEEGDTVNVIDGVVLSPLEIRVLGPVEVSWGGRVIDMGGMRARALIARLLIDRNLTVPVDRLLDAFWSDQDGEGAEKALRTTVSRLRKRLRDAGVQGDLIETRALGYALSISAESTDVFRFERLVAAGRSELARGNPRQSSQLLQEAQDLWRGAAYSDVRDEPFARAEARRLEELRLTAWETRFDAEMTLGQHDQIVGELESLTDANPMRERLWSQRMLALYRSGRQAEALRVYQDLRTILIAELGIEPGHDAQWLEQAILQQSRELEWIRPEPPSVLVSAEERWDEAIPATPLVAPAGPTDFDHDRLIGRDEEYGAVTRWWEMARRGESRLLLINGDAGIGKTRLVSELARAEGGRAVVLWGRCDEDPVAPFQPFAEALGRYFHSLSADEISVMPEWRLTELSRLVLRLSEYASRRDVDLTDPGKDRFRFFGAVTETLLEAAQRGPVLLVLDDLHWANQPTMLLLRHLLRDGRQTNLGIAGLYRDSDVDVGHPLHTVLSEMRADRTVVRVPLQGLTASAVDQLVSTSSVGSAGLSERLFGLTNGNPLFLDELFQQLTYEAQTTAADPGTTTATADRDIPEAVKELVSQRVARLPQDVILFLHAAAVAGPECDATIVAMAAELSAEQRIDALDLAVESRLMHRVGSTGERYAFSHALVRDAIYGQLLRSRRVRYHHKIALATERAHADAVDTYANELAHHFYMGAALADADKAVKYTYAAGTRALRLLAFEEAVGHFSRGLEVAELYGDYDMSAKCDALLALAEAQNKAGDKADADSNFEKAAAVARTMGDPEQLAAAALRAGPLSYIGIVGANADHVRLLEEARSTLNPEDSRLRAMVTARLSLVMVYEVGIPGRGVLTEALALSAEAIAMARRLGDRVALGYSLNARVHALWGIAPAPERLAIGTELGQIADEVGDEVLALHGHMWRVRELLAQGDVDAVNDEIARFEGRDIGLRDPLASSFSCNVQAMLALLQGDFEEGERRGALAIELAEGYNELALSFYGVLLAWMWWQQDRLPELEDSFREILDQSPADYPVVRAALSLLLSELGRLEEASEELDKLAALGWETVSDDQTEGVSLAYTAAACASAGNTTHAPAIYERLRPYAGSAIVVRAPASACYGPADLFLGLLASVSGDIALAEVHFEAALRLARRMRSAPFIAAAEMELARALRQGGREEDQERIATLLRSAEESARRMGLTRIARLAATVS
ncbi:MAG TPA: BTAD domain-containing putative transcriptional regulator [Acidimicrobiales bacterium]|nr:BTAD domain-containing putative transcriptional regulator [Acidimicrobiales bacterium]